MKITRTEREFWYDTRIDAYMQANEHVRVFLIQCMAMSAYIHPHTSVYPYHCLTSLLLCARAQAVCIVHLATMQTAFCVILLRSTYCGSCRQTLAESLQTLQSPMLRGVRRRRRAGDLDETYDERSSVPGGPLRMQAREMPTGLPAPGCLQHRRRVVSWHEELRSFVRAAFWMGFVVDSWSHLAEVAARGEGPLVQARSKLVCVQLSFCHTDAFMITA